MTDVDRSALIAFFKAIEQQASDIYKIISILEAEYPGLSEDKQFNDLREATNDVEANANGLADYIGVATDANWRE